MASRREKSLGRVPKGPYWRLAGIAAGAAARRAAAASAAFDALDISHTVDLGLAAGDLPLWRAKEAVRHAEVRLAVQVQANQALEGRAASMLGWSVTGLLALAAGLIGGTHVLAASSAAACLGITSLLCVYCILRREFRGVPGYEPAILLQDASQSEYEALVSLAKGYQQSIDLNTAAFNTQKHRLAIALVVMAAAPLVGLAALLLFPASPAIAPPILIPLRAALAWAVCRSAPHSAGPAAC
jgi:hypothetical protein